MSVPVVVLDACVLYPAALRDLLMRLAVHGLLQPKWSETIHEEWMEAVLRGRPDITREHLERTRKLMDLHAADSLVYGYERHLNKLNLPDPDDRHVLAAAIESGAETLLINARTSSHVQQVTPSGKEWRQGPRQMLPEGDAAAIHQVREAAGKDRIQHGGVPIAGVCFGLPIPWFSCGQHFQKTLHDRGVPDRRI